MPTYVQVGWHDSPAHVKGFSCWKGEADGCDVIRWCHCCYAYVEGRGYKRRVCMSLWAIVWVFGCCTFELPFEEPPTLCCSYFGASWGVRVHLYRKVFFICLTACAQGYLGDFELFWHSCSQVNWVAHLPGSTWTWYRGGEDCNLLVQISTGGINCYFGEPTNPPSIPEHCHI